MIFIYTIIKKISLYFLIKAGYVFSKKTAAAAAVEKRKEKSNSGIAASFLFYFYHSLSLSILFTNWGNCLYIYCLRSQVNNKNE